MKKNFKFLVIAVVAISLIFSCATTNSFMKANRPSISEYTLDNGIKLIVKKQNTNRIFTMKVAYEGGLAVVPEGKDGIESITLSAMLRGSKKYSFEDIKKISFENSSEMAASAGIDYSTLNLSTIDKYWDTMLDVFTDAITNPVFDEKQLQIVKLGILKSISERNSDPMAVTTDKLHEHTFKGHPYARSLDGTEKIVKAITVDDVKKWYSEKLMADRMMIVAVGNFDNKKLLAQLNETLGKLPTKNMEVPKVAKLSIPQACYTEEFPASKGIAYIRGDYEIPELNSPDFTTLQFAYSIFNELLFEVVRTQNAACYSVGAGPKGFKASYGAVTIFKTDKPTLAKTSIDEAISILASGKTINLKSQGIKTNEGRVTESKGPKYAPIAETIEAYKAKFINSFYGAQVTNSAIASQIISSEVYFGNPYEYLKFIDGVNNIKAEDVVRVANTYLANGKISWMIVGDKSILSKVEKDKFMKFSPNEKK